MLTKNRDNCCHIQASTIGEPEEGANDVFGRVGELTTSGVVKFGRWNSVDRMTRMKHGVDGGEIRYAACFDKAVRKYFLREVGVKMIIRSMLPLEFDTKEVRHLSHKVNTGEGFELALKGNVSVATRAKINKSFNIKCKVELILAIRFSLEYAWIVGGRMKDALR